VEHEEYTDDPCIEASKHPAEYFFDAFLGVCKNAAGDKLENHLQELCLDPSKSLESGPWYFPSLISTLHEYQADFIKSKSAGMFNTSLGQKVFEVLVTRLIARDSL